jgi:hypothetical protein
MLKKALGSLDSSTGVFTPAPRIDMRGCLEFSFSQITSPAPASPPAGPSFQSIYSTINPSPTPHLHYGGSPTANPRVPGCKPQTGRTFRQQKRLELMVQLENAAVPEHAAAAMLGISFTRLKQIKKSTDYLKTRMQLTLGIVIDHGQRLTQVKEQRKEILTQMLPQALQVIANAVQRPALSLGEQKFQVAVAQDILDREGSLAKVSKSEVRTVDKFDWNFIDSQNRSIMDVVRGSAQTRHARAATEIQDTLNLSRDFSSSRTIDPKEQQEALEVLEKEALAAVMSQPPQWEN